MTVPATHSGTFTADELDAIASQHSGLDADYYRRMAADQRAMGFTSTWMVLDPADYSAFKRYPVPAVSL